MNKEFYNFKFWHLFIIITFLYIVVTYLAIAFIYTDNFYYASLSDKFDVDRITAMIAMQHKFQIFGYLFLPLVLLFKLLVIAGVLLTGLYLLQQEISYKNCLKMTLIAELVSVVAMLVKTAWLMIGKPADANDLQYFSPLSITQILYLDKLPKYLIYPLQLLNVFEFAYWLILTFGVMTFTHQRFAHSLKAVASSYGVALLVWVVFVVFVQVQFT